MEHNSSYNKQLRKVMTARAVMNKKIRLLAVDVDKNDEKIDVIALSIESIKLYVRGDGRVEKIPNFL